MPPRVTGRFLFICLLAAPVLAQTKIGGGTCDSASLKGTYALSFSGRQLSTAGAVSNVVQANGTATFDGLSAVTITLAEYTGQPAATTPVTQSGTYSVEANCVAVVNINPVSSAILNVAIHNQGKDFQLTGFDYLYSYSGSGVVQPESITCSTATLNGAYTFSGTGYGLTSNAVDGAGNGAGLLQFDGQGNITVTFASSGAASRVFIGSYSISSDCLGSATLNSSTPNVSNTMSFSIYSVAADNTSFYVGFQSLMVGMGGVFAGPSSSLFAGAGRTSAGTCSTSDLKGVYP